MSAASISSLAALAFTVLIVLRFARRELTERTIRARTLWIRPAILVALTAYLIVLSAQLDPRGDAELPPLLGCAAALGALVGWAIVRNTSFAPAEVPRAIRVRGGWITLAIWIGALGVRVLARYVWPHGADPRSQLPLNCATVTMTAVAFIVIAGNWWWQMRPSLPARG